MKICITAQGKFLDSKMEAHFGRSPYFIIYDTDTANFTALENSNLAAAGGVGLQSAQLVADQKVAIILTGQVGPKAAGALAAAGIKVVNLEAETIADALKRYQEVNQNEQAR